MYRLALTFCCSPPLLRLFPGCAQILLLVLPTAILLFIPFQPCRSKYCAFFVVVVVVYYLFFFIFAKSVESDVTVHNGLPLRKHAYSNIL